MLTEMKLVPHSHFGMPGSIQKHTLVYTVVGVTAEFAKNRTLRCVRHSSIGIRDACTISVNPVLAVLVCVPQAQQVDYFANNLVTHLVMPDQNPPHITRLELFQALADARVSQ